MQQTETVESVAFSPVSTPDVSADDMSPADPSLAERSR
jgi:hypothetical protein